MFSKAIRVTFLLFAFAAAASAQQPVFTRTEAMIPMRDGVKLYTQIYTPTAATEPVPMLLLRTDSLPDSEQWLYELKLDGYRAIAFKRGGVVHLRSRNDNDFSARYPGVVKGLAKMPDNTVIDGEVIAFDDDGRPSFNAWNCSDARCCPGSRSRLATPLRSTPTCQR
mgnify:CR=1 FL=1